MKTKNKHLLFLSSAMTMGKIIIGVLMFFSGSMEIQL